jgi:hypothetical protein
MKIGKLLALRDGVAGKVRWFNERIQYRKP